MEIGRTISREEVVSKLKDDGDFDRLRRQIIRKLKDNEDLRACIGSMVRQSAAINQPGFETMKPRQLSDAILGEIGDDVKSKISDGLWEIIQSVDGMKKEITETVQSVCDKLLNPKAKEPGVSSSPEHASTVQKEAGNNAALTNSAIEVEQSLPDNEPNEPPGFSVTDHNHYAIREEQHEVPKLPFPDPREQKEEPIHLENALKLDDADTDVPPGFHADMEMNQPGDVSDEDPDVPPGFG